MVDFLLEVIMDAIFSIFSVFSSAHPSASISWEKAAEGWKTGF
jgi:hypothetical protein